MVSTESIAKTEAVNIIYVPVQYSRVLEYILKENNVDFKRSERGTHCGEDSEDMPLRCEWAEKFESSLNTGYISLRRMAWFETHLDSEALFGQLVYAIKNDSDAQDHLPKVESFPWTPSKTILE